jgi:RHS repeat-associated protein
MHGATGEAVWSADLNGYGEVLNLRGKAEDCPFRYPGQYEDMETGLYYNRFRYYDAREGMYVSQDPIGLWGGQINIYSYVNDPNNWIDPAGLEEIFTGTVYRGMIKDADGQPVVYSGETMGGKNAANSLGVRPGETGMSTDIHPDNILPHRKPSSFGGAQKGGAMYSWAMYSLDTAVLGQHDLVAIKDGKTHVSIITRKGIDPEELGKRLAKTKGYWNEVKCR